MHSLSTLTICTELGLYKINKYVKYISERCNKNLIEKLKSVLPTQLVMSKYTCWSNYEISIGIRNETTKIQMIDKSITSLLSLALLYAYAQKYIDIETCTRMLTQSI